MQDPLDWQHGKTFIEKPLGPRLQFTTLMENAHCRREVPADDNKSGSDTTEIGMGQ